MSKKILIRATGILPPGNGNYRQGIGRSNYELLQAILEQQDTDLQFSIYCNQPRNPFYNFDEWPIKHYRNLLPHTLNDYCSLEAWWRKAFTKYDLFHITDNYAQVYPGERFVVTIHDMQLYKERPRSVELFQKMGNDSLGIVTCSEYTKQEIIKYLHVDQNKITVIPWGINHSMFYPRDKRRIENILAKYHINNKYFFACSCAHPRKNARDILLGFKKFISSNKGYSLVLTWGNVPENVKEEYRNEIRSGEIIFLEYVNDEELACLYSGALASLLVSSLEGFGFPILESMACGTNCITCNNSSLTEIGSDKAVFVHEHDIDEIANAMKQFADFGKGNVRDLIRYSSQYTWENTAINYINFYKKFV